MRKEGFTVEIKTSDVRKLKKSDLIEIIKIQEKIISKFKARQPYVSSDKITNNTLGVPDKFLSFPFPEEEKIPKIIVTQYLLDLSALMQERGIGKMQPELSEEILKQMIDFARKVGILK